jgi:hypothetical protein
MDRVSVLVENMVKIMQTQQMYYRATESAIIQFTRMAKTSVLVRQWMYDNRDKWRWVEAWLEHNVRPPYNYGYVVRPLRADPCATVVVASC